MYIVHTGYNGPEGYGYIIAGVYSTKDKAMEEAKVVAESMLCDDGDTMTKNTDGYVVEVTEEMGVRAGGTVIVKVTKVTLDKTAEIYGDC